jgi:hypothetical protein
MIRVLLIQLTFYPVIVFSTQVFACAQNQIHSINQLFQGILKLHLIGEKLVVSPADYTFDFVHRAGGRGQHDRAIISIRTNQVPKQIYRVIMSKDQKRIEAILKYPSGVSRLTDLISAPFMKLITAKGYRRNMDDAKRMLQGKASASFEQISVLYDPEARACGGKRKDLFPNTNCFQLYYQSKTFLEKHFQYNRCTLCERDYLKFNRAFNQVKPVIDRAQTLIHYCQDYQSPLIDRDEDKGTVHLVPGKSMVNEV